MNTITKKVVAAFDAHIDAGIAHGYDSAEAKAASDRYDVLVAAAIEAAGGEEVAHVSVDPDLHSWFSDAYKDENGIRPRGDHWTIAEVKRYFEGRDDRMEVILAEEKAADERALAEFEAGVTAAIEAGAGDRETALRWLFCEIDDSIDHELWKYGLNMQVSYELQKEIRAALAA